MTYRFHWSNDLAGIERWANAIGAEGGRVVNVAKVSAHLAAAAEVEEGRGPAAYRLLDVSHLDVQKTERDVNALAGEGFRLRHLLPHSGNAGSFTGGMFLVLERAAGKEGARP